MLAEDVKTYEEAVQNNVKTPITQNMYNSLVSLTYNIGPHAFANSTLLRELNRGNYQNAANEFDRWVNARGQRLDGLARRREAEKELFLSNDTQS